VLGFFLPSQMDHVLHQSDMGVLSSIAFFGISSTSGGNLHRRVRGGALDSGWKAWIGPKMDQVIARAHDAGTKVVLTVTRFSWNSEGYHTSVKLLSNQAARSRLAHQIAAEVTRRGVDGVNIDFEPIPSSETDHFTDLVRRVRTALDGERAGLELTVATTGYIANYDIEGLTAPGAADAIYIMAYHYSGSWSNRAGAVSPLHRKSYDVTDTVTEYLKHTTANKLILGMPYYGNVWSTTSSQVHSKTRPGSRSYGYPGSVIYSTAAQTAAAHGRLWDSTEQGPWTRWQSRACGSCPLTWRQLYYEDAQSLGLKYDLVNARGLRGTGIWTLGFAGNGPELDDALREAFGSH
jgi:spore germination protein YaaH